MAVKSTLSPRFTWGRVFAVRWKRKPIEGKSSSTTAMALVSKSMPMMTIGSTHVAATAQPPDVTSRGDSCSRGVQDDLIAALTIAAPIVGAVPIAGSPLKAAVGGLLEILKAADVSSDVTPNVELPEFINEKRRQSLGIEKTSRSWKRNFVGWTMISSWSQLPRVSVNNGMI